MEELLNKLIEKGWKPFGNKKIEDAKTARWNINLLNEEVNKVSKFKDKVAFTNGVLIFDEINLRELVSKESGLWQFCVKNRLVKEDDGHIARIINLYKSDESIVDGGWGYHYWLMICSILDESELEDFLLSNIVIKDEE